MSEPTEQPPGVWIVAQEFPYEGITHAQPYATEIDALRALNDNSDNARRRVYYVPFGADLREVMKS